MPSMYYPAKRILNNPPLFIGSEENAVDAAFLTGSSNKIKLIINVTRDVPTPFKQNIRTLRFGTDDHPDEWERMLSFFPRACREIHEARQRGEAVLVHCVAGVSRSSTIVAAYLMFSSGKTAQEAVSYIQKKKPETFGGSRNPLGVFNKALKYWEKQMFSSQQ